MGAGPAGRSVGVGVRGVRRRNLRMKLQKGQRLRVRETFFASGVPVQAGWVVHVDWVTETADPDNRRYEVTVSLTPVDPPGRTILWGRSHPLEDAYLDQIFAPE